MTTEEKFEELKADYIRMVERHLTALKRTKLADIRKTDVKADLVHLRLASIASYEPLMKFIINGND